jgi:hypothetical protein
MPALKEKKPSAAGRPAAIAYRGRQTKTGNSSGFRFEVALFKSHPEFNGEVKAHVIAPGRMLITADSETQERTDPVMASFLAFLAQDVAAHPEKVRPLDGRLLKRTARLVKGVVADPDENLGNEDIL